ncbi:MAG: DEAD/DEAH box helicase [Bacteroidota bacterium]
MGDEKQISPESVGIDREQVNLLREQLLYDLPLNEHYGVDSSLYTHAHLRFRDDIKLREHFRCMPEIIQFSNNLCYAPSQLEPLKQYGADRLEPIRVVRVAGGYRAGEADPVNPPEAEALVERIAACCMDRRYQGKSMGVISLQGAAQAALIEKLLLRRLEAGEIERRGLICGDAYSFQGDERDIIFLSLVAAPGGGRRIGALTRIKDEQRFNVAASRAREQMWLFHTAGLNDLHPDCLRYKLLNYCKHPKRQPTMPVSRRIDPDLLEPARCTPGNHWGLASSMPWPSPLWRPPPLDRNTSPNAPALENHPFGGWR